MRHVRTCHQQHLYNMKPRSRASQRKCGKPLSYKAEHPKRQETAQLLHSLHFWPLTNAVGLDATQSPTRRDRFGNPMKFRGLNIANNPGPCWHVSTSLVISAFWAPAMLGKCHPHIKTKLFWAPSDCSELCSRYITLARKSSGACCS